MFDRVLNTPLACGVIDTESVVARFNFWHSIGCNLEFWNSGFLGEVKIFLISEGLICEQWGYIS